MKYVSRHNEKVQQKRDAEITFKVLSRSGESKGQELNKTS